MRPLRILIDIDGIVADTLPHWLQYIGFNTGVTAKLSDINEYDLTKCAPLNQLQPHQIFGVLQEPGFTTSIPIMTGAREALKVLMDDGHEVYLVTARSGAQHVTETFRWVSTELPFIDIRKQLIFLYNKHLIPADVIIDDQGATLTKYKKTHPNALALGIEYPYNVYLDSSSDIADRDIMLVEYADTAWVTLYQQILQASAST